MNAVEFTAVLKGSHTLQIPEDAFEKLPKTGRARVIVLTDDDADDAAWRAGAYEQFLREDPPEDGIYDTLR
jgi:predicted AAA+ superfamily ATPase